MPIFRNMNDLKKHLQQKINNALVNEVAQVVKSTESKAVKDTVYDAYSPRYYVRRGNHGGLSDESNLRAELLDDGILQVQNLTPPNPEYPYPALKSTVAEGVEYGREYTFFNPGPRPFTKSTVNELDMTGDHIAALEKGLQRQGIKTK